VNVDFRWWGASVRRVEILAAALALVAVGCMVLGWGSRSRLTAANDDIDAHFVFSANHSNSQTSTPSLKTAAAAKLQARSLMAGLPLMFEPNQGQGNLNPADPRVRFVARGSGYSLLLGSEGAILNLSARTSADRKSASRIESLQMKLAGANAGAQVSGADLLPGKSNYLLGNDPAKWKREIPQFARVRYENVYPGVNLVFYGNQGRVEYDFQVAPGADPNRAELEFDGAKRLAVQDGALVVTGENGRVRFDAPRVYQEIAGQQQPIEGSFVLRGAHRAGFSIGAYDHSRELVIDPILVFSTYFGGSGDELSNYVAIDQSFNVYLAGSTNSGSLATPGTFQTTLNGTRNVYIAKITPSSPPILQYVTYLGGNGTDTPVGIGVDGAGDPYVAGTTTSTDFPHTLNAYQASVISPGNSHVFVTRLQNTAQTLAYSSYLSGSGEDLATGMTIDQSGFLYVTGTTTSTNPQDYASGVEWPVVQISYGQPYQNTPKAAAGVVQFFVSKINTAASSNSSIAYSTYFGGGEYNTPQPTATGGGIAVDTNSNIYFSGTTNFLYLGANGGNSNSDFPILNAYQPCLDTTPTTVIINPPSCSNTSGLTNPDAFVAKLNPNASGGVGGSQLVWSTYLGGGNNDSSTGVALDAGANSVFITGTTNSSDIASSILLSTTTTAYQRCLNTPINPAVGTACSGSTASTDAYVAKFTNLSASTTTTLNLQLTYFSYLGGSNNEEGLALAVNASDGALLTGWTQSTDFPQSGTQDIQGGPGGGQDAFIASLNTNATTQSLAGSWSGYFGGSGSDEGTGVALDANQNVYFAGDTSSPNLQVTNPLEATNQGGFDAFVTELGTASSLTISGVLTLGSNQTYISAGNPATFTYTVTNTGSDTANNVTITDNLNQTNTGLPLTFVSATASSGTCSGGSTSTSVVCTIQSLASAATATITIVLTPLATTTGNSQTFTGGTVSVSSSNNVTPSQTSVSAQMSDFTMSTSPSSFTVPAAGNPATYFVQLTPHPVYTTNVALSCAGVPAGSACTFSPTSVTLNGAQQATLAISTTARPIVTPAAFLLTPNFYAMFVVLPILGWLALGAGDRRRRRVVGMMMLCAVFVCLMMLPACSHQNVQPPVSGTPAGNYTITVTASAGSDTKTSSVQLTVP
jgi:uncharacterized repeat protein (TIGR01451 family)